MAEAKISPLVWVKDDGGNRWLCPIDALKDPNSVSAEERKSCVTDAAGLKGVSGDSKLKFGKTGDER